MTHNQRQFVEFLLQHDALQFGHFTLKSGKKSPYFLNLGQLHSGESLAKLGQFYANQLMTLPFDNTILYGPAYKGIPLVASVAIALHHDHKISIPYCFNRKEIKNHGDKGLFVGSSPKGRRILMIDDVVTAGTTIKETLHLLQNTDAKLTGLLIALDRQEKNETHPTETMTQMLSKRYNMPIYSIITLSDVLLYLREQPDRQQEFKILQNFSNNANSG